MAETKKKTTASKTGTKKSTTKKTSGAKKTNTTKKTSTVKKTTSAKTNTTKKTTTKKPQAKATTKQVKPKKEVVELPIKKESIPKVEIKEEVNEKVLVEEIVEEVKENNLEDTKEIRIINTTSRNKEHITDIGIITIIVGFFLLLTTTYLTGVIEINAIITNILVCVALLIEVAGIVTIVVNTLKK